MVVLSISPRRLTQFFAAWVTFFVVAHLVVQTIRFSTGDDLLFGAVQMFSIGSDGNFPTFYSAFALLFSGALLALIGVAAFQQQDRDHYFWFGLACIFALSSIDEMLMLHEHLIDPLRSTLNTSGLLFYAWVIPYSIGGLIFLGVYFRFLLRLPRRTAVLMVASGVVFVFGAVGMEMVGGVVSEQQGNANVLYVALQTVEETCEMLGIVMFIYTLADYIQSRFGSLGVSIAADQT